MIDYSFYRGKRVFLTGHTGFKGTWLTHILLNAGAKVTGFSQEPPTSPSLFTLSDVGSRITSIVGDVRSLDGLRNAMYKFEPEIVFHLAAQPLVRVSYNEPVSTYEINVMGTVNLLDAIRFIPSVRSVVNVTTDKVYENNEWLWGYRESDKLCGYDPYSNSKSCSELITQSYKNSFFNKKESPAISTARSGNVIGGGDFSEDRIIPDCVKAAQAGKDIIVRNPHSIRPYQHVLECLSGYLLLAERQFENKGIADSYNFGPDDESCVSTGSLVDLFCKEWKGASWKVQGDGGPHEANFLKLDCSKSKAVLGWKPKWAVSKAIEKVVDFMKLESDYRIRIEKQIAEYLA